RQVERIHVLGFAAALLDEYENDKLSMRSAKGYLSAVNTALSNARMDNQLVVLPVEHGGFPTSSGVTKVDRSVTLHSHLQIKTSVSPRLSTQLELLRLFGLRFKESCLINSHTALEQALQQGRICLEFGTKGGRPRTIPITGEAQIFALKDATRHQDKDFSLVPTSLTWAQYQDQCYREVSRLEQHYNFHSERHHYAQERYLTLMGIPCPVKLGMTKSEHLTYSAKQLEQPHSVVKALDLNVRTIIAEELGHSRVSITSAYLG
ncbi:integrase domain-containing protein, partial [Vibrio methylphosphonaticus]|uniref:integrase domain-containing protein n=1 Tax=Vibrio methylphosphonaticus TaxID=2946866 RepID=UPI002029DD07